MSFESFEEVIQACQELQYLKEQVKARSMIYQVEAKESMAKFYGLPLNHYYHLPVIEFDAHYAEYRIDQDISSLSDGIPFSYGQHGMIRTYPIDALPGMRVTFQVAKESGDLLGTISVDDTGIWHATHHGGESTRFVWYIYALTFSCGENPDRPYGEVDRWLQAKKLQRANLEDFRDQRYKQSHGTSVVSVESL